MDPDETLRQIRQLAGDVIDVEGHNPDDALELAEAVKNLDQWLSGGGFLPLPWREGGAR